MSVSLFNSKKAAIVASKLLSVGAIQLRPDQPFSWASGWKSPIYCDNRLSLSFPEVRTYIKQLLAGCIQDSFPSAEVISGVATAGIPQGSLVADVLDLPFTYVRSKAKGHGMENMIEGKIEAGQKVVVVEDLVSTGGSSLKSVESLRAVGAEVLGMVAIFTYGFQVSEENFSKANLELVTLSDYDHLIDEALRQGVVAEAHKEALAAWRQDPADWGK